jgi:hypothetical protein
VGGGRSGGFFNSAEFRVDAGAVLDFADSYTLGDGTILDGAGLVEVTGGNVHVQSFNSVTFGGGGLFQVAGGNLNIDGTFTDVGALELDSGGMISGSGTVDINGAPGLGVGTAIVLATMTWKGGIMSGSGTTHITFDGVLTIDAGGDGVVSLEGGRTLSNDDFVFWLSGSIQAGGGATILNGGILTILTDRDIHSDGTATFHNQGILSKNGGVGSTIFNIALVVDTVPGAPQDTDIVEVMNGTLVLAGGGRSGGFFNSAEFRVGAGAVLDFAENYTLGDGTDLDGAGLIQVTGGNLHIDGFNSVTYGGTGLLQVARGNVNVDGTLTSNGALELDTGGTISGGGSVEVNATLLWKGGTMTDSGTTHIATTGMLSIDAGVGDVFLAGGRNLNNNGNGDWWSGAIHASAGATILNATSFGIHADNTIFGDSTTTFHNQGLLEKTDSGGTTTLNIPLAVDTPFGLFQGGIVDVLSGTLVLAGGGHSGGLLNRVELLADSGCVLDFTNDYALQDGTTLDGRGLIEVTGGNVNVPGFSTVQYSGTGLCRISGGNLDVDGTLQTFWLTELDSGGTIDGGGTVDVLGGLSWNGGTMTGSGTTHVESTSSLSIDAGDGVVFLLNGRILKNDGPVTWSGGVINTSTGATIFNTATGTFDIALDSTIDSDGTTTFHNQGHLVKSSGDERTTFNIALVVDAAPFSTNDLVEVASGTLVLAGGGQSGGFFNSAKFVADAGTVLDLAGSYTLQDGTVLEGQGLVQVTGGNLYVPVFNTVTYTATGMGLLQVSGGALFADGTLESTYGPLELDTGGVIEGGGTVNVNVGLLWRGGLMGGSGTTEIAPGAQLVINAASDVSLVDGRILKNDGTIIWSSGVIDTLGESTIFNTDSGTFYIGTDNVINSDGTATFHNQGILTKITGSGTATLNIALVLDAAPFSTGDVVEVASGTLVVAGGGQSAGFFTTRFGGVARC